MADAKPVVAITYCTQCRWLLRAGWTAQELLVTFEDELGGVALIPGTGGVFDVTLDGALVWSRKVESRFPELKELKQRIRDVVAPSMPLGHSDNKTE
ncbi:SelT/SelW/SelH family protein [Dongia sp.]|uniref:SelT/SelW/SelH family protein n=1 Tax=Dongia sp. TaxID=1977262 RepID=UPI0035B1A779